MRPAQPVTQRRDELLSLWHHAGPDRRTEGIFLKRCPLYLLKRLEGQTAGVYVYYNYCDVSALTDTGRRRSNNEDAVLSLPDYGVFCVADGMGGAEDGEVASHAVVKALQEGFAAFAEDDSTCQSAAFKTSHITRWINQASRWIFDRAVSLGHQGSGSTVVVFFLDATRPQQACCLHAGDSRVYRYRKDTLKLLTTDHSMAEEAGKDERDLPAMMRGVITRAVGVKPSVKLEQTVTDVQLGDVFVLCSDGLTKMLKDGVISGLLAGSQKESAKETAGRLVAAANTVGGVDNISVVVVKVVNELSAPIQIPGVAESSVTAETAEETGFIPDRTDTDAGLDPVTPTPATGDSVLDGQAPKTPTDGWADPGLVRSSGIFSKKSFWSSTAAILVLVSGLIFFFAMRGGKSAVEHTPAEVLVQIDCSSMTGADNPPVSLSLSETPGEFKPITGIEISLTPGRYELRAECPDYEPFIMPFIVEAAGQTTSLTIPALTPEPVLKQLRDAQQAVTNKDFQGLEKIMAQESSGIPQFAGHRTALRGVKSAVTGWKAFLEAKTEYNRRVSEPEKIAGGTVAEAAAKYASNIWQNVQKLATEAEKLQTNPLLGQKKYEEALNLLALAKARVDAAVKVPVGLVISCDIKNATVWRIEHGVWNQIGVVNEPLSLAPFVFHTLEIRAPGCQPEKIAFAAAGPGENLGMKQVALRMMSAPAFAPEAAAAVVVAQNIVVEPVKQEASVLAAEVKPAAKSAAEFISETDQFFQEAAPGRLAVFKQNYLSAGADDLSSGACWENVQKHDGNLEPDIVAARTRLYKAIYKRAVSMTGEMALRNAIRNRPNPSLQTAWTVLKNAEPSATKDFYNWLANEGGHDAIEKFVRASEPRR